VLVKMHSVPPGSNAAVLRVRPRSARPYLTEVLLDLRFDAHAQPALGPLTLQHLLARPQRLGVGTGWPAARRLRPLQRGPCPFHPRLPLATVLVALLRAA